MVRKHPRNRILTPIVDAAEHVTEAKSSIVGQVMHDLASGVEDGVSDLLRGRPDRAVVDIAGGVYRAGRDAVQGIESTVSELLSPSAAGAHAPIPRLRERGSGDKRSWVVPSPDKPESGAAASNSRPRSGTPYVDGLVGVEANPGPNRKGNNKKNGGGKQKIVRTKHPQQGIGGHNKARLNNSALEPATVRGSRSGSINSITVTGTRMVNGSPATIVRGRCAFQGLTTTGTQGIQFQDAGAATSNYVYMNPRICCQNSNYGVPQGYCPIGVIAQPWRRFCFLKARVVYEPLSVTTSNTGTIAMAYDPEVITTSSLTTAMGYANFQCSAYAPVWSRVTLNLTPYLDRSKWFYAETPSAIATSTISTQCIQGTLMLWFNQSSIPASTIFGMAFLEFELALNEMGPTEVFTGPALRQLVHASEQKEDNPGKDEVSDSTPAEWAVSDLPAIRTALASLAKTGGTTSAIQTPKLLATK